MDLAARIYQLWICIFTSSSSPSSSSSITNTLAEPLRERVEVTQIGVSRKEEGGKETKHRDLAWRKCMAQTKAKKGEAVVERGTTVRASIRRSRARAAPAC